MKAYLRISHSSCDKSMRILATHLFDNDNSQLSDQPLQFKDLALSAILFITVLLSGPLTFFLLHIFSERLSNETFMKKFGALYKGFNLMVPLSYSFNGLFFMRRFFFALSIVTLKKARVI
jgi:hypothetical protein